jgi:hypothetical protein
LALVEVSVVEQRYRAVLEVRAGVLVTEAAARAGRLSVTAATAGALLGRSETLGLCKRG